jgi:hypothetical protein
MQLSACSAVWEMWEGRHAFDHLPMPQLIYKVVHQQLRPPMPATCPSAYADLMQRCLQHEARARPSSSEVLQVLRDLLKTVMSTDHGPKGCSK